MSKMQAASGNEVTVYTSVWSDEALEEVRDQYRIVRFKGFTIFRNPVALRLFYRLLRERKTYDVIHAHSHLYFSTIFCALVRMIGSTPLVVTNHGLISQTAPMWIQQIYIPTIGRWIYSVADKVICYTDTERDQLIDLGIRSEKISAIHNGVDTDHFAPQESTSPKKEILWIGKYVPGKGVEYLLRGFQRFSRNFPDYILLMIGRGPQRDDCLKMINDLGLTEKVILKDFVQNKELPDVYRQSSIFVLPSLEEGVPRTILEAMACGVPVVCTELPQLVDIVAGSGILVPVRDSEALAEALIQIVTELDRARELGENGRKRVVSDFSWDDTVRRTLELYEEVIASSDGGTKV